ncbi:MAG: DUF2851 family protein [Chloroflexi bacterium]|nr:DUF2851 family protein [Chloroflexota bacterium]
MKPPFSFRESITERAMARLWKAGAHRLPGLMTRDGRRLSVLYPGRPASGPGPDFRDALLEEAQGRLIKGDVELHLEPQGWREHGHQGDRRYRSVVLHVVLWPATGAQDPLRAEAQIPTVALYPLIDALERQAQRPPSTVARASDIGDFLDRAGEARFRRKGRAYLRRLRGEKPEEVLYQGLMGVLGYGGDRSPFLNLAYRLPLSYLKRLVTGVSPGERLAHLEALFLGAAGLRGHAGPSLAALADALEAEAVVDGRAWLGGPTRPANAPWRRLLGMAGLLDRHWDQGLLEGLRALVDRGSVAHLVQGLMVSGRLGPALIGRGRAGDMAVNVVLPFFWSWGRMRGCPGLAIETLALFRLYPSLQENQLTREMRRLLPVPSSLPMSARRQQGLVHLYKGLGNGQG